MLNQTAPDFSLQSSIGQPISKADLTGAYAVLIFYPANDSPTCNKQLDDANTDLSAFLALNARIFGVNTANADKQKEYCARRRIQFPILSDPGGKVANLYGAKFFAVPVIARTVVIIDPTGTIIYHRRGNSPPSNAEILKIIEQAQATPSKN